MNKIAAALVCMLFFSLFALVAPKQAAAEAADRYSLYLDGRLLQPESPPRLVNNTMLVPLRIVSEELGANVSWNQAQKLITVSKDQLHLQLGINRTEALVNGRPQLLDAAPLLMKAHTLIPVRFVSENLGLEVQWDSRTRSVLLKSSSNAPEAGSGRSDISGIALEDSTLTITTTGGGIKPAVSFMSDPSRLVVDIPDAALSRSINGQEHGGQGGKIFLDHPFISYIRYSLFQTEPSTVRIVLDLKQPVSFESKAGEAASQWVIRLSGDSIGGEEPSVDPPDAVPDPGGNPDKLPAIHAIGFQEDTLTIASDGGSVKPVVSLLSNPERLVVDIPNAVLASEINGKPSSLSGEIALNHSFAKTIRYGLFNNNPSTVRVIIDLKQKILYEAADNGQASGKWGLRLIANKAETGQKKYRVVLDAGHGGTDPGASAASGKYEKDFTLPMALKAASILQRNESISVYLTRSDDTYPQLEERAKMANDWEADLFVSIHGNSFTENRAVAGTETHYTRADSKPLAEIMHRHVLGGTGFKDRGVLQSNLAVTRQTTMPAVLLEIGFLSNPQEEITMWDERFQLRVAQAIADGIEEFLQTSR